MFTLHATTCFLYTKWATITINQMVTAYKYKENLVTKMHGLPKLVNY